MKLKLMIVLLALAVSGCAGNPAFSLIGSAMSNPLYVAVNSTTGRMYVVNSNYTAQYRDGSIHVVDISTPTTPLLVDYASMTQYAGQLYLNAGTNMLYAPSRMTDVLQGINVDEASPNFLTATDYTSGTDPFGITCCDLAGLMYVTSESSGVLDSYNEAASMAHVQFSMTTDLSEAGTLIGYVDGVGDQRLAIIGDRAVVTRAAGAIWIVELDQIGVAGTHPTDYYILNVATPGGITTDGVNIYVLDFETVGGVLTPTLLVLDISTLPPLVGNTAAEYIADKGTIPGLVVDSISLTPLAGGASTPAEVLVNGTTAYVSDSTANIISIVDLTTAAKTGEIAVGAGPYGMAFYSPGGTPTHLIVANSLGNTVQIIQLSDNTVVGRYPQ